MLATETTTTQLNQPPLLATIPQAARMLAVSERSLWALIARGDLTPVNIGDRSTRLWIDELRQYALKNTQRR